MKACYEGAHTLIFDEGRGQDSLQVLAMELLDLVESRVETPLIYVYIFGRVDNQRNPSKHRPCDVLGSWALSQVKGLLLSLKQPVYGVALGEIGSVGTSILEVCDFAISERHIKGIPTRVLLSGEIDLVMTIIAAEAEAMNAEEVAATKTSLLQNKLRIRRPQAVAFWPSGSKYTFDI
mmetsp:Transcript_69647/g.163012  ORF Transcript_69647/g.163012 Transcript_69647/m.163012 type:complete len:178 (+) Transcript_69647:77-610(+)